MSPYLLALLYIVDFILILIVAYALVKTVTVAVLDAKAHVKERKKKNG